MASRRARVESHSKVGQLSLVDRMDVQVRVAVNFIVGGCFPLCCFVEVFGAERDASKCTSQAKIVRVVLESASWCANWRWNFKVRIAGNV